MSPHDELTIQIAVAEHRFEDTDDVDMAGAEWDNLSIDVYATFNVQSVKTTVDYEDVLNIYKFRMHITTNSGADNDTIEECVREYLVPRWYDGIMMLDESRVEPDPAAIETEGMG